MEPSERFPLLHRPDRWDRASRGEEPVDRWKSQTRVPPPAAGGLSPSRDVVRSLSASRAAGGLRQAWRCPTGRCHHDPFPVLPRVSPGDTSRLIAWHRELAAAHERLRSALRLAQDSLDDPYVATRDLLLYCVGFCAALGGHHRSEDAGLFPELVGRHPELAETIAYLKQDHAMIAYLLGGLEDAVQSQATPDEIGRHLEGLAAIMESHFRYEERQLLTVLETVALGTDPRAVLGPL